MPHKLLTLTAMIIAASSAWAEDKLARCESLEYGGQPPGQYWATGVGAMPSVMAEMETSVRAPSAPSPQFGVKRTMDAARSLPMPMPMPQPSVTNTEKYAHTDPNPVHRTADTPVSTFSVDVDTGSYGNVRRYLRDDTLPPGDAVRLEEIVNYFSYDYALPKDGKPFAVHTAVVDSPWQPHAKLLRIALQAADLDKADLPPANLVFLIDTSGSMDSNDKLGLAQKTVCYFAANLRKQDMLTLITYSGHVSTLLEPTAGDQFDTIYQALEGLSAGGSTAGESAIRMAYDAAEKNLKKDGINRILIATDGDFNVGVNDTQALKSLVADKRKAGISLSTLGFGTGNYNDEMMEQIADAGDGNYSYIDTLEEAKKVLVRQLSSTLATVAHDVKIQIEFNPVTVKEYRLVGYENRVLREEDFNNDQVDAGDIGAGHRVTAFYELIPQGEKGWLEDSRYAQAPAPAGSDSEYAFIKLRYKTGQGESSQLIDTAVARSSVTLEQADSETRFAIAAAAFAQALQGGQYNAQMDWESIKRLAQANIGEDPYQERAGMVKLIEKAQKLSASK